MRWRKLCPLHFTVLWALNAACRWSHREKPLPAPEAGVPDLKSWWGARISCSPTLLLVAGSRTKEETKQHLPPAFQTRDCSLGRSQETLPLPHQSLPGQLRKEENSGRKTPTHSLKWTFPIQGKGREHSSDASLPSNTRSGGYLTHIDSCKRVSLARKIFQVDSSPRGGMLPLAEIE